MGMVVNLIKNEPTLKSSNLIDAILDENKLKFDNVCVEPSFYK